MTIPHDAASYRRSQTAVDTELARDLLAVVLLLVGVVGLVGAAFMYDTRLGIATLSAALIAAGVLLGLRRS